MCSLLNGERFVAMQVSGALSEGTDADTAALNVEMGSLAVPNSAQHAAETALASLEARGLSPNAVRPNCRKIQWHSKRHIS